MRTRAGNRAEFFRVSRRDLKKVARCVDDAVRAGKRQLNPFAKGLPRGSVACSGSDAPRAVLLSLLRSPV
jgi:hypothetical protein